MKRLFAAASVAAGLLVASQAGAAVIISQDFENIDVSDNGIHPGFLTDYSFRDGTSNSQADSAHSMYDEGTWTIGTNPYLVHDLWKNEDLGSKMLILNGATDVSPFSTAWAQEAIVTPGAFVFSFDAADVCCNGAFDPNANAASLLRLAYSLDGGATFVDLSDIDTHITPQNTAIGYHVTGSFNLAPSASPLFDSTHPLTLRVSFQNFANAAGGNDFAVDNINVAGVPEPASWALMLVGFGGLGAVLRNRRRLALAA
jgi:hypothetical protein